VHNTGNCLIFVSRNVFIFPWKMENLFRSEIDEFPDHVYNRVMSRFSY
jgi:hypothetical protein